MSKKATLSANQKRAMAAMLQFPTIRQAAKRARLTEKTLYRYLSQEHFKTELSARQDEIIAATTAALVGLAGDSVKVLHAVMKDADTSAAVKVRAALGWLTHTRASVELDDLSSRVAFLEEQANE